MKEIITMFYFGGRVFDLDFTDDTVNGLYIIYDKISKHPVSRVIEAKNDLVAIRGFEETCAQARSKNDYSVLQLIFLGDISYENKIITNSDDEDKLVCDSNFDFKEFYEESFAWLNAQED